VDLDEEIKLNSYDPAWEESYEIEAARLSRALDIFEPGIAHFGSTADVG
jgi:GrpB-like predicted nucleotidyltransferase (UPF0157 family)